MFDGNLAQYAAYAGLAFGGLASRVCWIKVGGLPEGSRRNYLDALGYACLAAFLGGAWFLAYR